MKRLISLLLVLLFAGAVSAQENSIYFQGSFDEAVKYAGSQNKNMVVFFHADG